MRMSAPPPSTGPIAGKYRLVRMLGRGGMGSVWEASHVTLGTRFAIKFIEAQYAGNEELRRRFRNEAIAAARLQSRHVVQVLDHGCTDEGEPYIVMEMLQGQSLRDRLETGGRLSLADTARVVDQVARALTRAHASGIVHRDLKPENIFLAREPDSDQDVVKVVDFGIAKLLPSAPGETSGTRSGMILGTWSYMSPEQARGLRSVDQRSDLWSLGVVAYRCVVGELPFDAPVPADVFIAIVTGTPPAPSRRVPDLPAAFDAWFARAVAKDPESRFQSAAEMSLALAEIAGVRLSREPGAASLQPPRASAASARVPSAPSPQPTAPSAYASTLATTPSAARTRLAAAAVLVLAAAALTAWLGLRRGDASSERRTAATAPAQPSSAVAVSVSAPASALASQSPSAVSSPPPASSGVDAGARTPAAQAGSKASGARQPAAPPRPDPGY
jgi:serine/threonine-protein kinase